VASLTVLLPVIILGSPKNESKIGRAVANPPPPGMHGFVEFYGT
jgi:hypothetical protein